MRLKNSALDHFILHKHDVLLKLKDFFPLIYQEMNKIGSNDEAASVEKWFEATGRRKAFFIPALLFPYLHLQTASLLINLFNVEEMIIINWFCGREINEFQQKPLKSDPVFTRL